jgi:hypothetical protein
MNRLRLLPFAVLLASLAGCATTPPTPGCTRFGRDGQLCLLPPASLPPVEGSHLIKVMHDGREDAFVGLLHIDDHALRLAGFSLFGTSLFNIEYDGESVKSAPAQGSLKPDMLVAMLELAIADPALLQERLHGLSLNVSSAGGRELRDVSESGRLIAHIEESGTPLAGATIHIEIPPYKISVEMTPMDGAPLQPSQP